MDEKMKSNRRNANNMCPLCINGEHTMEQHKREYYRQYMEKRNEGKVAYKRGYYKTKGQVKEVMTV